MPEAIYQNSNQLPIKLSSREIQVLKLVVEGCTNPEIAISLHLSPNTIKTYIGNIMNKLAVQRRTQIAVFAVRNQLI